MAEINKAHIEKVFSDEAFVKSLFELEEPEDVQAALKEKGIDFTLEEVKQLGAQLAKAIEARENGEETDELSHEQLDDVAGGFDPFTLTAVGITVAVMGIMYLASGINMKMKIKGKRW